jgi:hypothetical protein
MKTIGALLYLKVVQLYRGMLGGDLGCGPDVPQEVLAGAIVQSRSTD